MNLGTSLLGHCDDLMKMKQLCQQYNLWLHTTGDLLGSLSIVTNLEHFRLNINQNENDFEFPFEAFARLLNEHVEYLKDFQLKIPLNHFQMTDFDFITRLHPLFSHGHINQDEKNSLIISSR